MRGNQVLQQGLLICDTGAIEASRPTFSAVVTEVHRNAIESRWNAQVFQTFGEPVLLPVV